MIAVSLQRMKGQHIRYRQTGEFHFLTFSCYRRRPYLKSIAAMEILEDALERVRLRYLFVIAGYIVMPEHVHLLDARVEAAILNFPGPQKRGTGGTLDQRRITVRPRPPAQKGHGGQCYAAEIRGQDSTTVAGCK
jgi:hypothetical protein